MWLELPAEDIAGITPGSVAVIMGELWFVTKIEGNAIYGEIIGDFG